MFHGNGQKDLLVKEMPNHLLLGFGCTNARIINVGHWTVLFWWFSGSWLALLGIPLNYSFIMYQWKD